jgi:hypothetical protein
MAIAGQPAGSRRRVLLAQCRDRRSTAAIVIAKVERRGEWGRQGRFVHISAVEKAGLAFISGLMKDTIMFIVGTPVLEQNLS